MGRNYDVAAASRADGGVATEKARMKNGREAFSALFLFSKERYGFVVVRGEGGSW